MQDYVAPLTATGSWGGTYFAHPFNNDNLNTNGGFPVNNSIKYTSANYGGFTFGGTNGFSNQRQLREQPRVQPRRVLSVRRSARRRGILAAEQPGRHVERRDD
jgi:predicted porin